MTAGTIRPIAICLLRRGHEILVFRAHDPVDDLAYYRPLGGGILFGERSEDTVRRELREEIGAELERVSLVGVFENTFEMDGVPAHEIVFVYEAAFADRDLYRREMFEVTEESETLDGVWRDLDAFDMATAPLYPTGLLDLIRGASSRTAGPTRGTGTA
jgi:ADP-ribose pyrophosphatase YjhB (NUDIX family)